MQIGKWAWRFDTVRQQVTIMLLMLLAQIISNGKYLNADYFDANWILQLPVKPRRTHAEIMRNWFKLEHGEWLKVCGYQMQNSSWKKGYLFTGKYYLPEYFDSLEMKTQKEIEAME